MHIQLYKYISISVIKPSLCHIIRSGTKKKDKAKHKATLDSSAESETQLAISCLAQAGIRNECLFSAIL